MRPNGVRGALVACAVLALGLTGCGQEEPAGEELTLQERIAEPDSAPPAGELEKLGSSEFAERTLDALGESGSLAFTTSTTTVGGQVPGTTSLYGAFRFTDGGTDQYSTGTGPSAADMVVLDDVLYMRSAQLGLGDKWLQLHLGQGSDSMYGFAARAHDPVAVLSPMREPAAFSFEEADEVDGVATNRYRVVVSAEAYLEGLQMPTRMATMLPEEITTRVWVDADDRIRRFEQEIEVPAAQGRESTTSRTDVRYSDFGLPVEINAPDATDVTNQLQQDA
ncbi:MAG: hypothetical protein ACI379_03595 [Nocardioides sp.]|uniref:hypothetical protein n=1 Tax=Nocardioides sp. TaxID=35761 RepID=UPI003F0C7278